MATKLPQSPHNVLEEIVADADLDVLGREDFCSRNQALRDELAASGVSTIDLVWYGTQLQFMQAHHYFTPTAHVLRDTQKAENIVAMQDRIAATRESIATMQKHLQQQQRAEPHKTTQHIFLPPLR